MSLPTALPSRNGERSHTTADVPLPPEEPLRLPTSPTRSARVRKAGQEICNWPAGQPLADVVRRIMTDLDVDPLDVPVLIDRFLPMGGRPKWSASQLRDAVSRHTDRGPSRLKSGGCEPSPARPTPDITPWFMKEMARREATPPPPAELVGIMATEVEEEEVEWFLADLIPRGYYTMVAGRRGVGKSTFFTGMAARARRTMWLCGEERLGNMVVPRLLAHGIRRDAVEFFNHKHNLVFPHCKESLIRRAKATGTDLVIVDPLTAFLGHSADANINEQMQPILQALDDLAERSGAAVLVCLHPGKAINNPIRGASVFQTHPRIILELVMEDGPPPRRMITNPKNNIIGPQPSREFFAEDKGKATRVFRLGDVVDASLALFATEVTDRLQRIIIKDCEAWLEELLSEGPKAQKLIMSQGKDESYSPATIYRAADRLGVLKERGNSRAGEGSTWRLATWEEPNPFDTPPSEEAGK